jgi:hypothetical protein
MSGAARRARFSARGKLSGRMLGGFFQYEFLGGRLIGSEHPGARGDARGRVAAVTGASPLAITLVTLTPQFERYDGLAGLTQAHVPMGDVPTRAEVSRAVAIVAGAI